MDQSRRAFLTGATGLAVASAGCLSRITPWGDSGDDGENRDGDTENTTSQPNATQPKTNDTPEPTDNTSAGRNESGEPSEANETNETNQVADPPEEESTQPEATELDDAVETRDVEPHPGNEEYAVTGEVWSVADDPIEVIVEVTLLDGSGTPLTDEPLVDGTYGLRPDDIFFFEVRTRDPDIVGNVENVEYTVTALPAEH